MNFSRAIAPGTWTFPSVTSIQSGLYPHDHDAIAHTNPNSEDGLAIPKQYDRELTLPNFMEMMGYETYLGSAFINPFLALQGWFQTHHVYGDVDAERVIDDYMVWRKNQNRTYSYLHFGDLHAPIDPPSKYINEHNVDTSLEGLESLEKYSENIEAAPENWREQRLRLYSAALEYLEDTLQQLIADISEDTFLIVTGDHGEAMWEHHDRDRQFSDSRPKYGVGHGGTPYDMIARVPVAVHHPSRSVEFSGGGWPSLIDISNTICSGLGLDDNPFGGFDWFQEIPSDRMAICEATGYGTERKAVYQGNQKMIHSEMDNTTLTASLEDAYGENFETIPKVSQENLMTALPNHWENIDSTAETSTTVQNRLKALGYK
jgi:arylsulfatase A-like enzyme